MVPSDLLLVICAIRCVRIPPPRPSALREIWAPLEGFLGPLGKTAGTGVEVHWGLVWEWPWNGGRLEVGRGVGLEGESEEDRRWDLEVWRRNGGELGVRLEVDWRCSTQQRPLGQVEP